MSFAILYVFSLFFMMSTFNYPPNPMASACNTLLLLSFFVFSLSIFSTASIHNHHHHHHPLDPLSLHELDRVRTIITASHHNISFHYVGLDEPDKSTVLSWLSRHTAAKPPPRRALVIARLNHQTRQFIVDLSTRSIVSDEIYGGSGYPILTFEEQTAANSLALSYAPIRASVSKRGLKVEEIVGLSFTVGWYGEEGRSRRIVRVMFCYLDGTVNIFMRPIEGITVTVDLDEMKVIEHRDRLMVTVPKADGTDYRESAQKPPFGSLLKCFYYQ